MQIRQSTIADVPKIRQLGSSQSEFKVSKETVDFWPESILQNATDSIFVAEVDSEIIGFVICNYNPNFQKTIIENIYVQSDFRKQKVASKLLTEAMKMLKKAGCKYFVGLVEKSDERGEKFYAANKFQRGIDCMWLDLTVGGTFKE